MKKIATFIIILLGSALILQAQERSTFSPEDMDFETNYGHFNFWELKLHTGGHVTSRESVEDILSNGYTGLELRVGVQSSGRQQWQRLHKYPQYGIGFALFNVGSKEVIGNPSGLFGFINLPIIRRPKFVLGTDISVGLSYDFNPYHVDDNPQNSVIGSKVNLWAGFFLTGQFQVSMRSDITAGLGFIHFSNGRTHTPNMGLNMLGLHIGYTYHYNPIKNFTKTIDPDFQPPIRPEIVKYPKPIVTHYWEFSVFAAGGIVSTERPIGEEQGPRYPTASLVLDVNRRMTNKLLLGIGTDVFYDGSIKEDFGETPSSGTDYMLLGWHFGPQFMIERFTLVGQVGFYYWKGNPDIRGNYYFRAGGKFDFTDNFFGQISLKTRNGFIADWIEWGIGFRFMNKEKYNANKSK